jgi:hypothetical protein
MESHANNHDPNVIETGDASAEVGQPPTGVGYKQPPINTRFKKWQSGNRKGRPKGGLAMRPLFERLMKETVPVKDGDKQRRIATSDALMQVLVRGAIRGEPGAVRVQSFLEDKIGLLNIDESLDPAKRAYLTVPEKLPREEWAKVAREALYEGKPPPKPEQKLGLYKSIDGKSRYVRSAKSKN